MKIYFAGPLFTPYVRSFISEHAKILRANGIEPFVPHEKFNQQITPAMVATAQQRGLLTPADLQRGSGPERVTELVRQGKLSRAELGLPPVSAQSIYRTDYEGLTAANAVVAIVDGTQMDDGTACEIGIFFEEMKHDPKKKGIVGWATDSRAVSRSKEGFGQNMFCLGIFEYSGGILSDFNDVIACLKNWEKTL
jgi:nucleoside 2-deoxyribosyltransferase